MQGSFFSGDPRIAAMFAEDQLVSGYMQELGMGLGTGAPAFVDVSQYQPPWDIDPNGNGSHAHLSSTSLSSSSSPYKTLADSLPESLRSDPIINTMLSHIKVDGKPGQVFKHSPGFGSRFPHNGPEEDEVETESVRTGEFKPAFLSTNQTMKLSEIEARLARLAAQQKEKEAASNTLGPYHRSHLEVLSSRMEALKKNIQKTEARVDASLSSVLEGDRRATMQDAALDRLRERCASSVDSAVLRAMKLNAMQEQHALQLARQRQIQEEERRQQFFKTPPRSSDQKATYSAVTPSSRPVTSASAFTPPPNVSVSGTNSIHEMASQIIQSKNAGPKNENAQSSKQMPRSFYNSKDKQLLPLESVDMVVVDKNVPTHPQKDAISHSQSQTGVQSKAVDRKSRNNSHSQFDTSAHEANATLFSPDESSQASKNTGFLHELAALSQLPASANTAARARAALLLYETLEWRVLRSRLSSKLTAERAEWQRGMAEFRLEHAKNQEIRELEIKRLKGSIERLMMGEASEGWAREEVQIARIRSLMEEQQKEMTLKAEDKAKRRLEEDRNVREDTERQRELAIMTIECKHLKEESVYAKERGLHSSDIPAYLPHTSNTPLHNHNTPRAEEQQSIVEENGRGEQELEVSTQTNEGETGETEKDGQHVGHTPPQEIQSGVNVNTESQATSLSSDALSYPLGDYAAVVYVHGRDSDAFDSDNPESMLDVTAGLQARVHPVVTNQKRDIPTKQLQGTSTGVSGKLARLGILEADSQSELSYELGSATSSDSSDDSPKLNAGKFARTAGKDFDLGSGVGSGGLYQQSVLPLNLNARSAADAAVVLPEAAAANTEDKPDESINLVDLGFDDTELDF